MRHHRPAMLAVFGGLIPTAGIANLVAPAAGPRPIADSYGVAPGPLMIALVAILLVGLIAMLVAGRMSWLLGAIVMIGCIALLGGAAIIEGIETAIAVSP